MRPPFTLTWARRVPQTLSDTPGRAASRGRGHVTLSPENALSSPGFLTWLKCHLPREASPWGEALRLGPGVLSEKSSADNQWFQCLSHQHVTHESRDGIVPLLWSHTALDLGCRKRWMGPWMGGGWIDGWVMDGWVGGGWMDG